MKNKTFLAILLLSIFTFTSLHAQTEKGRFVIGANTSLDVAHTKGGISSAPSSSLTSILFQPNAGYLLLDDFSVGVSINYAYDGNRADVSLLSELKYYFPGVKVRPFVKANAGYRNTQRIVRYPEMFLGFDVDGLVFGGGVGAAFFVRNNVSIDLGVQYFHSNLDQVGKERKEYDQRVYSKAKIDDVNIFAGFSVYL